MNIPKIKILILVLFFICLSKSDLSFASIDSYCQEWFLKLKISSHDPNCEMKCLTSEKDFSSFICGDSCEDLCQPIQCENPPPNQCLFYAQCIEEKKQCGPDGYAVKYGQKYCLKFLENSKLSDLGQKWRDSTLLCLQKKIIPVYNEPQKYSCKQIESLAFNSHVDCYTQKNATICKLNFSDLAEIIINIIELKDTLSWNGIKQEVKVAALKCLPLYYDQLHKLNSPSGQNMNMSSLSKDSKFAEIEDLKMKINLLKEIEGINK